MDAPSLRLNDGGTKRNLVDTADEIVVGVAVILVEIGQLVCLLLCGELVRKLWERLLLNWETAERSSNMMMMICDENEKPRFSMIIDLSVGVGVLYCFRYCTAKGPQYLDIPLISAALAMAVTYIDVIS